ncbi:MAG: glycosyltransferase family 4 protein [Candidatus Electrothrix gigas]
MPPHGSRNNIEVFYGYDHLPRRTELITGGLVKVHDLLEKFPNNSNDADLVYLISSALPHFPPGFASLFLPTQVSLLAKNAIRNKRPIVLNQNGVAYPAWCPAGWKRINRNNQDIMRQADYVIFQSEFCRKTSEKFLHIKPKSWEILHNPVNTKLLVPVVNKKKSPWRLLVTGSHWEFYRIESAVRALEELVRNNRNVVLYIAGAYCWGQDMIESEKRIFELACSLGVHDRVILHGSYSQDEVVDLFGKVHVLLHTKYNDPCPRSVIESMSCGVPVVYSASGGVPELVDCNAGVGLKAPTDWEQNHPPDSKELAGGVEQVFADYSFYSKGARACAVNNFDVCSWIKRHEEIFREILRTN